MADKTVSMRVTDPATNENLSMDFQYVTEVKPKEELESDTTKTFDGPVVRGTDNPAYTIDINLLDLTKATTDMTPMEVYSYVRRMLKLLRNNHGTLSLSEVVKPKVGGAFRVSETYSGVLLASNNYTISAEDLTARELSFSAEDCEFNEPTPVQN